MPGWAMSWSARKMECQQSLGIIGPSHHGSSPWTLKRATLRLGTPAKLGSLHRPAARQPTCVIQGCRCPATGGRDRHHVRPWGVAATGFSTLGASSMSGHGPPHNRLREEASTDLSNLGACSILGL